MAKSIQTLTLLSFVLFLTITKTEETNPHQGVQQTGPAGLQNLCGENCVSCEAAENGSFYCTRCYRSALVNGQCQQIKDLQNCEVFNDQGCEYCGPGYGKHPAKTKLEDQCRPLPPMAEGSLIAVFDKITPTRYTILVCETGTMSPDAQTCVPPVVIGFQESPICCKYAALDVYSFVYESKGAQTSCWRCDPHCIFGYATPYTFGFGLHSCQIYNNKKPNLGCLRTKVVTETQNKPSDQMCVMCDFYIGYFMYAPGVCKNPIKPQ